MKKPKLTDLKKYALQGGRKCTICGSPHLEFIRKAYQAGFTLAAISRYLSTECGVNLSATKLTHHYRNHEHTNTRKSS